jgi:RNA polymerase sigma-70 factor, ECF subfamily
MRPAAKPSSADADSGGRSGLSDWLERFHRGERDVLEACYRDHFGRVGAAVGSVLRGADRETVVHEVFYRLLSDAHLRSSFRGGAFEAWLSSVAHHQAIDYWRQQQRESVDGQGSDLPPVEPEAPSADACVELRLFVHRFRTETLPAKWLPVFDARFINQLDQREAARRLGIRRTTLAYQELQIRRLLRRFVRKGQMP